LANLCRLNSLINIIKQDFWIYIYVAYIRSNGWTDRANFLWTLMGGRGVLWAKQNSKKNVQLFFHGQRRALLLVYIFIIYILFYNLLTNVVVPSNKILLKNFALKVYFYNFKTFIFSTDNQSWIFGGRK